MSVQVKVAPVDGHHGVSKSHCDNENRTGGRPNCFQSHCDVEQSNGLSSIGNPAAVCLQ